MMKLIACSLLATSLVASMCAAETVDPFMGDWQGRVTLGDGPPQDVAVHLIPRGGGNYEARVVRAFNERSPVLHRLQGRVADGQLRLLDAIPFDPAHVLRAVEDGVVVQAAYWTSAVQNGAVEGTVAGRLQGTFVWRQSTRVSPTLGKEPPAGAVVLFDGSNLEAWKKVGEDPARPGWKLLADGSMEVKGGDIVTRRVFGDQQLHLEFKLPYMPYASGQGRANSGVYLQGRYEVQVLDSYGLEGEDNECGGVYQVAKPLVNMCAPPLQWQTYDITFRAARFEDGHKVANARLTVIHNGVVIQDDIELPKATGGAIDPNEAVPGGLKLQDHGNPVQFRNIWLLER